MKIHLDKDDYCHLIDFKAGKFVIEGYYHNKCWHEGLNKTGEIKERTIGLLNMAEKAMKLAGFTPEEKVYEIPTQ